MDALTEMQQDNLETIYNLLLSKALELKKVAKII